MRRCTRFGSLCACDIALIELQALLSLCHKLRLPHNLSQTSFYSTSIDINANNLLHLACSISNQYFDSEWQSWRCVLSSTEMLLEARWHKGSCRWIPKSKVAFSLTQSMFFREETSLHCYLVSFQKPESNINISPLTQVWTWADQINFRADAGTISSHFQIWSHSQVRANSNSHNCELRMRSEMQAES